MEYKSYRSTKVLNDAAASTVSIAGTLLLKHDERHIRRKLLHFSNGDMLMLDLKEAIQLHEGSVLEAQSGEYFRIQAAVEPLYTVTAKNRLHLLQLVWHLGNRHLLVEVFEDHLTLLRDHVIRNMLERLGAKVEEIEAPFQPLHGAYHSHFGHMHSGHHGHNH